MTAPTPPQRPLIVYVDDERANRIVFEASLPEFHIKSVDSGEQALALLASHDVAVLVTDMRMPGMPGDELLRLAKQQHPQVIRMVVTAHSDIDPILRAINEGLVARYIIKPWERDELAQVLQWACEAWVFGRSSAALHQRLLDTERLATLGTIAGRLVHDLRQPLMSQMANIEYIAELAHDAPAIAALVERSTLPVAQRERIARGLADLPGAVADLKVATEHLSKLIGNLRELGKPRRDEPVAVEPVDPVPIIRHAIAACQELVVKSRSTIGYSGAARLPRVFMLETELLQVLINVVANAAQAVAARGVPGGRVAIDARPVGNTLEIQIQDTGVGMTPEVLKRVGTPFFTTRADGTGLGVSQCQRLVGSAGGRFLIDSEAGVGTTVTIVLPLAS